VHSAGEFAPGAVVVYPALQARHVDDALLEEYVPRPHGTHALADRNVPAAHTVQTPP
jgi:hypothetical protein